MFAARAAFLARSAGPVEFDAAGAGANGTGSISENHTIAGNAIIAFVTTLSTTQTQHSVSVTAGGVSMTLLDAVLWRNVAPGGNDCWLQAFGLLNPPQGSQSVAATIGVTGNTLLNSVSYKNVSAFGARVQATGATTSASLSVPSDASQMVAQAFASLGAFSAYNKSERSNQSVASLGQVIGDAVGASSLSITATTASAPWGGIAVPLIP